MQSYMAAGADPPMDEGSGSKLPPLVLSLATLSATFATVLSLWTVWLQLKNYRKVTLQRFVVRILVMVPIYALSSLISLYSLDLAFFVDAVRDIYEAFVIYCFFTLLVEYLGGERSLIILLHGRAPVPHPWPVSYFFAPMDVSDPFTFLGLKRGVLQYVQIKPILAAATVILKAAGTYKDGSLEKDSGYTYVSIVYNLSVFLSLYCLAMFWVATHDDLLPFRPMPKFLCVKGIIFFSFWQGFMVSILVAIGWVKSSRYPTEQLSLAIQDTLICFEMPLFALMHLYAFSYTDYIDNNHTYSGRLPFYYAIRDAFGYKDIFSDSITTAKGTGFSYRTFEPASGSLHVGLSRERRLRAGLRYSATGDKKYWLPMPGEDTDAHGRKGRSAIVSRPLHAVKVAGHNWLDEREGYAPISEEEDAEVLHRDKTVRDPEWGALVEPEVEEVDNSEESEAESLGFEDLKAEEDMEELYDDSRRLEFGDFNYPIVDASKEEARRRLRDEEEGRISYHKPVRTTTKSKGKRRASNHAYGRLAEPSPQRSTEHSSPSDPATSADHPPPKGHHIIDGAKDFMHHLTGDTSENDAEEMAKRKKEAETKLPPDAIDLVVEDKEAEEEEMIRERRRGEPGGKRARVYRQIWEAKKGVESGDAGEAVPGAQVRGESVQVKDRVEPAEGEGESEVTRLIVQTEELQSTRVEPPPELVSQSQSESDVWK